MDNYYQDLPKKRMGSGVLVFDKNGHLLILKSSYRDKWQIPGGVVEENETPKQAVIRETKEEIGIDIHQCKFLCVDYVTDEQKGESLQFVFYGGEIDSEEIQKIKLAEDEIINHQFIDAQKDLTLLTEKLQRRIPKCLEALRNKMAVYLENENIPE